MRAQALGGKLLYVRDRKKAQRILLKASREAEDFEHRLRIVLGR